MKRTELVLFTFCIIGLGLAAGAQNGQLIEDASLESNLDGLSTGPPANAGVSPAQRKLFGNPYFMSSAYNNMMMNYMGYGMSPYSYSPYSMYSMGSMMNPMFHSMMNPMSMMMMNPMMMHPMSMMMNPMLYGGMGMMGGMGGMGMMGGMGGMGMMGGMYNPYLWSMMGGYGRNENNNKSGGSGGGRMARKLALRTKETSSQLTNQGDHDQLLVEQPLV